MPRDPPDWTRFDIGVSLRNLRSFVPSVIQRELRKLHLRWWHASEGRMRTILKAVGLEEAKLNMIKPIVDTCRECRAWQRRGNRSIPSISLPTKFLDEGECDLMFYKRKIAFHIIDRAIRYGGACQIENKETATLIDAYVTTWVQRQWHFKTL